MKLILTVIVFIALSGCNGKIYTVMNPKLDLIDKNGKPITTKVEGVIAYQIVNVIELYEYRALVDKTSGIILGEAPDKCTPDKLRIFTIRADYNKPYMIKYDPGFLDTYKFSLSLENGVLTSVNAESDPSKTIAAMAQLISSASKAATLTFTPESTKFCNAKPKFIGLYKAPNIESYDKMPKD